MALFFLFSFHIKHIRNVILFKGLFLDFMLFYLSSKDSMISANKFYNIFIRCIKTAVDVIVVKELSLEFS